MSFKNVESNGGRRSVGGETKCGREGQFRWSASLDISSASLHNNIISLMSHFQFICHSPIFFNISTIFHFISCSILTLVLNSPLRIFVSFFC